MDNYVFTRDKLSKLGSGSFATVYLAKYEGLDTEHIKKSTNVAIKIIQIRHLTPKALSLLEDEISIMRLLSEDRHPNIVYCYDVIRLKDEVWLILEYCDSGSLKDILQRPIKEKYAQFYFCQLANGLRYLDSKNIIHRDIKPQNILLTNKRKILKIADFGFAKQARETSLHDTMCGSPLYMSPEILNRDIYNNQSDLWSIGMLLYELLYGQNPFNNCKTVDELKDTMTTLVIDIPPHNTKNKDVSPNCTSLLKNLLEKKVMNRITWDEFFDHPWVKQYHYDKDYDKQLIAVSPELFTPPHNISGNIPIIRKSKLESLSIIDNFYDTFSSSPKVTKERYSPEDCLFKMEFDDSSSSKKIVIKKIMEKSSLLDDDDNKYDMIE
jgi:serine/threonine-protein kinase ULK/ATG1